MIEIGALQDILYLAIILALVKPLGWYMATVYAGKPVGLDRVLKPIEYFIYRCCDIHPEHEMGWKNYLSSMLFFNLFGMLLLYVLQRLQVYLPLNPQTFASVTPDLAFNSAASYVTNTNWQAYSGESTMSYLTQMLAFTVQNFLSAATGISLLIALIRGLARDQTSRLGNFWVDTVRGILYILLPLSILLAIILSSQGVIQNFKPYQSVNLIQPIPYTQLTTAIPSQSSNNSAMQITTQTIPMGPVASQVAIKQLGTNGGGFFNTNSAYPFENPTPLTNFFEMLAMVLIPAALCYTFGILMNDTRQGWSILFAMMIIYIPFICATQMAEQVGNPAFMQLGIDHTPQPHVYPAGNMEGKETRFGIINSALWATATTATSNGSVNAMHDSFTPLGGLAPLWLMHLGEVVFGGVGSGLSGMLMMIIITVFVAGLMVGRTPEYLGKKIEHYEMKMAALAVLVMPVIVLVLTAIATTTHAGVNAITNPGAHGFTQILYAFTSMVNNNGSAFAGLDADNLFYNVIGGIAMLIGRYWVAIPMLAIAGSLARKKIMPTSPGTLPTHSFLFIILLISIIIVLGALTFFPALILGPVVEHLMLWEKYGY